MAYESTRSSRAAIVSEISEGVPLSPSTGNDYIALQEGFAMEPNFETIQNDEISGSIGKAATVQGLETPTASFSHYLRHSGVEGQVSSYNLILKSLFGTQGANATERTTAAASTVSLVKLTAGGSDFSRGKAILLKDGTNGYSTRNVLSVATNDLTLAFNLASAPAAGVNTGKCVYYAMSNAAPSFTLWNYMGDGGGVQMEAGTKTVSGTLNFPAGAAINADYTFAASSYYFYPVEITSTSKYIDFKIDAGAELTATLTEKTYRDVDELRAEIQSKMDAATTATITCTYSNSTGKFTIAATAGAVSFDILWNTGTNTANSAKTKLGFSNADDTGALSYTSDSALVWSSPQTPTLDSESFLIAKSNELMVGSSTDYACLGAESVTVNFGKEQVDVLSICATSGKDSTIFNSRDVTIDIVAYLTKYDVSKWLAFKNNTTVQFAYNAGRKSSGNWVPGSVVNLFSPTAKISSMNFTDLNGIIAMNLTLTCFCDSAQDEFYMNML